MMESGNSSASLTRFKPAIVTLTAAIAALSAYTLYRTLADGSTTSAPLRRRGAVHRRAPHRDQSHHPPALEASSRLPPGEQQDNEPADNIQELAQALPLPPLPPVDPTTVTPSAEDASLKHLLFRISEDHTRSHGRVHRGKQCDSCGVVPIRGTRYHCVNCPDFDLCQACEANKIHPKTHVFYKIEIPVPFFRDDPDRQDVWYPGSPDMFHGVSLSAALRRYLAKVQNVLDEAEVEGLWETFTCVAGTPWTNDPHAIGVALSREDFARAFGIHNPRLQQRHRPSLIYDRAFAFFDSDANGLVGFEEFIVGMAVALKRGPERTRRVFDAYDVNGDGFVDRNDFKDMLQARWDIQRELILLNVKAQEEETARALEELVPTTTPFAYAFQENPVMIGNPPPRARGKYVNELGDEVPTVMSPEDYGVPIDGESPMWEPMDDFGADYLETLLEDGFDELLDPLFEMRERIAFQVRKTANERKRRSAEIAEYMAAVHRPADDAEVASDAPMSPSEHSMLDQLLQDDDQYDNPNDASSSSSSSSSSPSLSDLLNDNDEDTKSEHAPHTTLARWDANTETFDPTMPQFMPSTERDIHPPTPIAVLALLEKHAAEIHRRGGPGRIDLEEYLAITGGTNWRQFQFCDTWLGFVCF